MPRGRRVADIDTAQKKSFADQGRMGFKNIAGTLALSWMTLAYKKIVESYWTTEDLRSALHQRLQT